MHVCSKKKKALPEEINFMGTKTAQLQMKCTVFVSQINLFGNNSISKASLCCFHYSILFVFLMPVIVFGIHVATRLLALSSKQNLNRILSIDSKPIMPNAKNDCCTS